MPGPRDLTYVPNNEAAAAQLAEFGALLAYFEGFPGREEEDGVRAWIADVAASGSPNAVYLDTTTVATARRLLGGDAPTYPAALFDLANFVNAVILCDTVFHLESPHLDSLEINEFLGLANDPPLISVPMASAGRGVGSALRGAWLQSTEYVQRIGGGRAALAGDATEVKAAWERLLGGTVQWADWGELARDFTSRAYGDVSVPAEIFETAARLFRGDAAQPYRPNPADRARVSDFILECNNRSVFNWAVGGMLGIQYVPNAFRLPFHQFLYRKGHAARQHFVRFADQSYRRTLDKAFPDGTRMHLPFFLSAILAKSATLAEFKEMLADHRLRAAPFRARRAQLNAAVRDARPEEVDGLLRALEREEAPKLWQWCAATAAVGTVAGVVAAVETHAPGVMVALEVAAEVTAAPAVGVGIHTLHHLFRPRTRFLHQTAEAALKLGEARAKIAALWNMRSLDDDYAEALNRVGALEY